MDGCYVVWLSQTRPFESQNNFLLALLKFFIKLGFSILSPDRVGFRLNNLRNIISPYPSL